MDYLFHLGFIRQRVRKVDKGFKREYREDTITCGAKNCETATTRFGCKLGRISRAQIIAATKVCDLLTSRKKTQNLVPANKSTLNFYKTVYHFASEDTCMSNILSLLFRLIFMTFITYNFKIMHCE